MKNEIREWLLENIEDQLDKLSEEETDARDWLRSVWDTLDTIGGPFVVFAYAGGFAPKQIHIGEYQSYTEACNKASDCIKIVPAGKG